jgi:hypothetical protein
MDVDLRDVTCWEKLDVSSSTYQEIKYRLGYKGKRMTIDMFNEIEEIVVSIRCRYGKVTLGTINRYWNYVRKEEKQ